MAFQRKRGWTVGVAQQWIRNPRWKPGSKEIPGWRKDLFGFADLAMFKAGEPGTLYVNACSDGERGGGDVMKHVDKISQLESARACVASGNRLEVWGWAQRGPRGAKTWSPRIWRLVRSVGTDDPAGNRIEFAEWEREVDGTHAEQVAVQVLPKNKGEA